MSNVYRGVLYLPQATISRKSFDCDRIPPRVAKLALAVGAGWLRGALAGPGSPCVLFGTRSDRHSVRSRGATPSAGPTMPDRFQAARRSGAGGVRAPTPPPTRAGTKCGESSVALPPSARPEPFAGSPRGGHRGDRGTSASARRRAFSRFRRKPSAGISRNAGRGCHGRPPRGIRPPTPPHSRPHGSRGRSPFRRIDVSGVARPRTSFDESAMGAAAGWCESARIISIRRPMQTRQSRRSAERSGCREEDNANHGHC